jgi:hypothetical protein
MLAALALAGLFFLDIGDRTEMRLRATTGPAFAVDLTTMPYVRFATKVPHLEIKAGYAAMLTQPDLEMGLPAGPQLFQLADVSTWYSTRHWVVGVSEGGGYGDMNFSYLSPVPITPGQPVLGPPPTTLIPCTIATQCADETIHFGSSATFAMLRWSRRRFTAMIAPSYSVGGGTDAASKALVPIVSSPRVDLAVEYRTSRRDVVITEGDATTADSTPRACDPATGGPPPVPTNLDREQGLPGAVPLCAPRAQWGGLRETWRHSVSRRLSMELSAGAAVARATTNADDTALNPLQPFKVVAYPTLRALFTYALLNNERDRLALHPMLTDPPKPSMYAVAKLGPVIDTRYGIIDPRFEIGLGALEPIGSKYTLSAHAAFVRSVPPTALDATYIAGWVELLRRIDKYRFEGGGGVRGAYQNDPFTGEFFIISIYATLVWHEPRMAL